MGYIRHRAVLAVTTYEDQRILQYVNELRKELNGLPILSCKGENLIIESVDLINKTKTYIFVPDGSKLGWDAEKLIEPYRKAFMYQMNLFGADCIYLEFGGDDFGKVLIDHGDVYRSQE